MRSFGTANLLVMLVLAALAFDSRRLRAFARSMAGRRPDSISGPGLPAGGDADRVGLSLRQIQMRHHVDWQDGGIGWDGPEILPVDEPDDEPVEARTAREAQPNRALPVLWKPFPALPAAGTGC